MSAEGMYRKRDGWSDQHSVRVKYDGAVELEVPEKFYKEKGWLPLFDDLPWAGESAGENTDEIQQRENPEQAPGSTSAD
jgi:hypothetical protein